VKILEDRSLLKVGSTTFLTIYEKHSPTTIEIEDPVGLEIIEVFTGTNGTNGQDLEIRAENSTIQTRYTNEVSWKDLIDLTTVPGKSIEMNVSDTHIQWRLTGDPLWIDIISLEELRSGAEYVHPSNHPASIIVEDANRVFISETEKENLLSMYETREYVYNQILSSSQWNIEHNLNRFPSVSIVDSAGSV
jgi:hypothetical protein